MTQQDFSDPNHRIDNLSTMRFVRAYATVRYHVLFDEIEDHTTSFLKGYITETDRQLAVELQLPEMTLFGRLTDLGRDLTRTTDAKDEAE